MRFKVAGLANFVADDAAAQVRLLVQLQLGAMRQAVTNEQAYAAAYATAFGNYDLVEWVQLPPKDIAQRIAGLVRAVGLFVLMDNDAALALLDYESRWIAEMPPVHIARHDAIGTPIYTPTRQQQLTNRAAINALVHRAAVLAYAERLPSVPMQSRTLGRAYHRTVVAMFDGVIDEAMRMNDGTSRTLRRIQALCLQLINERSGEEPEDGLMVLQANMPSLVCAHLAYREARQAARIRNSNPTAHPTFMPNTLVVAPWP